MFRQCAREHDVRRMIREDQRDPALIAHAATCAQCKLTLEMAAGMRELAVRTPSEAGQSAPSASYLWWKAELLRSFDAQARVEEPVEIGERIGVGVGLLGAAVLLFWLFRQLNGWAAASEESLWATLPWLIPATLVVCTIIFGTAAAAAVINLGSWNRKE